MRRTLLLLPLLLFVQGCAWVPQALVARADHSEATRYELVEGSPMYHLIPRGWITPVNHPRFASTDEAASFMQDDEPVIVLERGGEVRVYSTWYLDGHEVVNDVVDGEPFAVTWCPLVQAGVVYERTVPHGDGERELTLQASGRLWRDALVMWDAQTRSLWTQHDGRALQGASAEAGATLAMVPSTRTTWAEARALHPDARVLRKRADGLGGGRATIYDGYLERTDQLGIFGTHLADDSLPGKTEVLAFERPESAYALSLPALTELRGVSISVGGDPVFAHVLPGGVDGRVWLRAEASGRALLDLALGPDGRHLVEGTTGTTWDAFSGRKLGGADDRADLVAIPTRVVYWFAWQGNHPDTRVWGGGELRDPRQATR
jgi:hypothetical protein